MINIKNIRLTMIKFPLSDLWNKNLNKWDLQDKKRFNDMFVSKVEINQIKSVKKSSRKVYNCVKILRVSDGVIYNSISECEKLNGFHNVQMRKKISDGIEFKRI